MLTVAFVAFLLFQYIGDPVNQMLGQDATPEDRTRLRADLGLDKPFYVQFGRFIGNVVQGDFGLSLRQGRSVSSLIKERLPATLELSFIAALIALGRRHPDGRLYGAPTKLVVRPVLLAASLVGISLPTFLIGILLILVFAVQLGWLPSYGRGEVVQLGWWSTGLLTRRRLEAPDPALDRAGAVPADADHAARAVRDAGSAANRLHQVSPARAG